MVRGDVSVESLFREIGGVAVGVANCGRGEWSEESSSGGGGEGGRGGREGEVGGGEREGVGTRGVL